MKYSSFVAGVGLVVLIAGPGVAMAADTHRAASDAVHPHAGSDDSSAAAQADNTKRNVVDRDDHTLTPEDQSNTPADVDLAKRIRRALTEDDSLSMDAKNIKVITNAGRVTLRGPIESREEHDTILRHVKEAGVSNAVTDQLEVKVSQ